MKLRQIPEDFIVEEIPSFEWKGNGKFAIFKVTKKGMTTFAAEKVLSQHCNVNFKQIGFAGLKDAHGITSQYFSVEHADEKGNFIERNVMSKLVGFLDKPLRTGDLKGNRFLITIRELSVKDVERAKANFSNLKFVPNYFDSQRFGSLRGVKGFIAKDVLTNNYESAVKKVITAINRHQKAVIRNTRKFINANWGKWDLCLDEIRKNKLEKTSEGTLIFHLCNHHGDFKGAFGLVFKSIREIFFSAYQSYIWNECVKQIIRENSKEVYSVPYEAGKLVFPRELNQNISLNAYPLVAPDVTPDRILSQVLKKEQIDLAIFNTDEHFFVARPREILIPINVDLKIADDERHPRKKKAILSFDLPKGAYATIVIKALFEQ